MRKFSKILRTVWESSGSLLCVGLDPDPQRFPAAIAGSDQPFFEFNREIIDATAAYVCAYKPQIAYYSAYSAERELERTIDYILTRYPHIPVILDAKRGDIGATARMYAREAFDRYQADAVTVNPYMGGDTLAPFLEYADRGVFVLCRTSNPGSGEFQSLSDGEATLSQHVARRATSEWNGNDNVGLVVGATWPREIGEIRSIAGTMPLLVPGVGAQGGDLPSVLENGLTEDTGGLLINVSRSIIYAGEGDIEFAKAVSDAAESFCHQVRECKSGLKQH